MAENHFDIVLLGTGITESIVAASLAKAGFRIVHCDPNPYYGGDEASLSLDELVEWADRQISKPNSQYRSVVRSDQSLSQSRQYSVCLCPSVTASSGPVISSLVASGVAKYGGFRLLEPLSFFRSSGHIKNVPGSKEEVFKSRDISLSDKRRLMRFLMFAAGDFERKGELDGKADMPFYEFLQSVFALDDDIATAITYSLAFCTTPLEPTLSALQRLNKYLRSTGRYGASPFLIGQYGGIGEVAQGFCRAAAVSGGVYILGRNVSSISRASPEIGRKYSIHLEDMPEPLYCDLIISSQSLIPVNLLEDAKHIPPSQPSNSTFSAVARGIAIIDRPLYLFSLPASVERNSDDAEGAESPSAQRAADAATLIYPPGSLERGSAEAAASVFVTGEGTLAVPQNKWIVYLCLPVTSDAVDAKSVLKPYLDATLALTGVPDSPAEPLFTLFYTQVHPISPVAAPAGMEGKTLLVSPSLPFLPLPEPPDVAAINAEKVFWEAIKVFKRDTETLGESETAIDSFWPPLGVDTEENDDGDSW
ncbi:FAD/NAD(P)-binding domain-containing protein [Pluteus cervinus]|uniref:FAD/NAD(P)-binding domain-containing protein n=1 Tax=Pluteus cervinus TaxID=181527 RepID=A0ACD3AG82_9AGAR|nr:FAD/NAD(P)-binding domain-containing protein [Pluteus cervinus]